MPNSKKKGLLALLGLFIVLILALGWWNRETLLALLPAGPPTDRGRPPPLVEIAPVEQAEIEARLQATGSLKAAETVTITARSRGRVEAVLFKEGSEVSRHQALVLLERKRAQAAVREAAARVSQTARQLERLDSLEAESFVSETELEEARAAASEARAALRVSSEDLADRIIEAPFDGLIGRRLISPGALLEPGMAIASLSRTAPLDLLLDVPGTELARIETEQRVLATTPAYPGHTFEGRVTFVAPEVVEGTRTLALEATFDNADHRLKPGMFMTAELITERREILRVPEAAVIAQGPAEHLFVVESTGSGDAATDPAPKGAEPTRSDPQPSGQAQVHRQPVQTGIRRDGWIEITRGVSADERVVVAGLQRLRDGMGVRISGEQSPDERPADDDAKPSDASSSSAPRSSSSSASSANGDKP